MKCVVPWGFVLGPLLYPVYVEMMCFHLQDVCVSSFADETALTVFVAKPNNALERLEAFTGLNLLCVNVK